MTQKKRLHLIVHLGLAVLALVVLAAGISNLELNPGTIVFREVGPTLIEQPERQTGGAAPVSPADRRPNLIYAVVLILMALVIIFAAYRSRQIRIALLVLSLFVGSILGLLYLYNLYGQPPQEAEEAEQDAGLPPRVSPERIPAELFENPPDWLDWVSTATTIGLLAVVATVAWIAWRWLSARRAKAPLEIVATEAEATLAEIRAGANLKDAVMRCYFDMNQALRKRLGLVRQEGMTPREFEETLLQVGLPTQSVQRLTRLFEGVRYGRQTASERDKREAVTSLETIIQAARNRQEQQPTLHPTENASPLRVES